MTVYRQVEVNERNASKLVKLLYNVYGYTYFDRNLYSVEGVVRALSEFRSTFLAISDYSEEFVAVVALRRPYPNPRVLELGMLSLVPEEDTISRGKQLRLLSESIELKVREFAKLEGVDAVISTEVTTHALTQRLVEKFGFKNVGLYLGWTPGWSEQLRYFPDERGLPRESSAGKRFFARRSETVSARVIGNSSMRYVAMPFLFEELITTIYDRLGILFEKVSLGQTPENTDVKEFIEFERSRAVIEVLRIGQDAADLIIQKVQHYLAGLIDIVHVVIPLTKIEINDLVRILVERGFVFAAIIPLYRDSDVLVLQYVNTEESDKHRLQLQSDIALNIASQIRGRSAKANRNELG